MRGSPSACRRAARKATQILERRSLGGDESQHDELAVGDVAQRLERPGAFVVELQEVSIDREVAEQRLGNELIAALGRPHRLVVASAEMGGDRQVVVLWLPGGESGEVMLAGANDWTVRSGNSSAVEQWQDTVVKNTSVVSFSVQSTPLVLDSNDGVQLVIVDRETAYGFWAPNLDADPLVWENSTGQQSIIWL